MRYFVSILTLVLSISLSVVAQDTVDVLAGWNMVGSLASGAVGDVVSTVPPGIISSSVFGYIVGVGYQGVDTLEKGRGYWVKVTGNGGIVFTDWTFTECGTGTVTYMGKVYHTVQIGEQCWMKENLDVGEMITGATASANNGLIEKYCYDDDTANCALYGGLYQWDEAMQYVTTEGARGICPPGWHIPLRTEFETLMSAVGNDGNALKEVGEGSGGGAGTNTSGFSALLGGRKLTDGTFLEIHTVSRLWSSLASSIAGNMSLHSSDSLIGYGFFDKQNGVGVRCLLN